MLKYTKYTIFHQKNVFILNQIKCYEQFLILKSDFSIQVLTQNFVLPNINVS